MKLLLVDDHTLIREALRLVLREVTNGCELLEASSAREASRLISADPEIALIFLDLRLPDCDGLSFLAQVREQHPAVSVVVLSAHDDRDTVTCALNLGAVGFIPKSANREIMLCALRLILSGGIYIPPEILASSEKPGLNSLGLTERQIAVLSFMVQGKSNKAICSSLGLAEPTVKNHVTAILKALNVTNRTAAVVAVAALGWKLPRSEPGP